jgi:hypothetical protein
MSKHCPKCASDESYLQFPQAILLEGEDEETFNRLVQEAGMKDQDVTNTLMIFDVL